ncbi:UDP-N-acetylmuramoyl-L-alanyl-D-glutamate--2,6-diaminopimelate ligase [Halopseudomonas sp.]|uniref:UDP-N-acetylmuramoyl-L-alanyl-D-glutamate--2, 6-diaminopimelate ligase n=1 Tax=Halopseudomonas sp. TaxID=2901191 RepID=UPI003564683A
MKTLQQLFPACQGAPVDIEHLTLDSREVRPGSLFLAVPGILQDGRRHIAGAIEAGAVAVAYESADGFQLDGSVEVSGNAVMVPVPGLATELSAIAGRFFGEPSRDLGLVGITGTNGKTSVSQMLAQALSALGKPCGVIGTLGSGLLNQLVDHGMTTPDAISVQRQLAAMRDQGAGWVSMEVSSHALDQDRVAALEFDLAVFTNLSRDHLDYHGDMASYGAAKAKLFDRPLQAAIINLDDAFGRELIELSPSRCFTYSLSNPEADLYCSTIEYTSTGIRAALHTRRRNAMLESPLLGEFNLANLLAVVATLLALEVRLDRAVALADDLTPPAGRMQRLGGGDKPLVVIDYAHTPDALEKALSAARAHAPGRLTCVFGCGGDRDSGKRPLMGQVAERNADQVLVTDDNPRSESSAHIIEQILAGMQHPQSARVTANRAEAILTSIVQAQAGDLILLAGKGHETYQEIDGVRHPFSDIEQAAKALQEWEAAHA